MELRLIISWISQTTLLKRPGPVDLLHAILRSGLSFGTCNTTPCSGSCSVQSWLLHCSLGRSSSQFHQTTTIIQNAAASLIFNEPKRMYIPPLFINLHWLPIAARIKLKALMFDYKTISDSATLYLNSVLQTSRSLNSASEVRITVPSQRGTKSL